MIYLSEFEFPHIETEYAFLGEIKRTCYDTVYPFQVLSRHQLRRPLVCIRCCLLPLAMGQWCKRLY